VHAIPAMRFVWGTGPPFCQAFHCRVRAIRRRVLAIIPRLTAPSRPTRETGIAPTQRPVEGSRCGHGCPTGAGAFRSMTSVREDASGVDPAVVGHQARWCSTAGITCPCSVGCARIWYRAMMPSSPHVLDQLSTKLDQDSPFVARNRQFGGGQHALETSALSPASPAHRLHLLSVCVTWENDPSDMQPPSRSGVLNVDVKRTPRRV
jgi:hypothetical protein